MTCRRCGGIVDLVDQSGGTNGGRFAEKYRCPSCGATGTISGESSDPPHRWDRYGVVFDDAP